METLRNADPFNKRSHSTTPTTAKIALPGMNADTMQQYVKFVADQLLTSLRQPKLFRVENPFPWMQLISLQGKTNFFEKRVSEYALAGTSGSTHTFDLDTSF